MEPEAFLFDGQRIAVSTAKAIRRCFFFCCFFFCFFFKEKRFVLFKRLAEATTLTVVGSIFFNKLETIDF